MSQTTNRLFLSELTLKNYRTYKAKNSLEFSPDSSKPFTIIHGLNAEGKTSLLNSIHWCLYGKERAKNKIQSTDEGEGIVNSQIFENLGLGKSEETFVEIFIYKEDHPQFHIKRRILTTKMGDAGTPRKNETNAAITPTNYSLEEELEFEEWDNESNGLIPSPSKQIAQNVIQRHFPEALAEYLLFDAELLDDFQYYRSDKLVKQGIEKITGLPILEETKKNLEKVRSKFEKEWGQGNGEYEALRERKEQSEKLRDEQSESIERAEKKFEEARTQLKTVEDQLSKTDEKIVNEKQKSRKKAKGEKDEWKKLKENNTEQRKELVQENIWKFYLKDTLEKAKDKFDKAEEEGLIPPTVGKDAYDKIIKSEPHTCVICQTEIKEGTDLWKDIVAKSEKAWHNASLREITLGRGSINNMIQDIKIDSLKTNFARIETDIQRCTQKHDEADASITELDNFINKIDEPMIQKLKDTERELEDTINTLQKEIGGFEKVREVAINMIKEINPKLDAAGKTLKKNETDESKVRIAKMTKILLESARDELEQDFKKIAQEKTEEFFLQFAPRAFDFSGVKIEDNYVVKGISSKDGLPKKVSAGQAHALGLSYLSAVRQIMKENYFMVIDSPFHNISQQVRTDFVDNCTKIAKDTQITLLVTDSEYTSSNKQKISGEEIKSVRDHLIKNNTLYKEYILDVICDICGESSYSHKKKDEGGDHDPVSRSIIKENEEK